MSIAQQFALLWKYLLEFFAEEKLEKALRVLSTETNLHRAVSAILEFEKTAPSFSQDELAKQLGETHDFLKKLLAGIPQSDQSDIDEATGLSPAYQTKPNLDPSVFPSPLAYPEPVQSPMSEAQLNSIPQPSTKEILSVNNDMHIPQYRPMNS
ncbi:MAG: hypothetical protein RL755_861, partial [Pseudomonadota bacterium]